MNTFAIESFKFGYDARRPELAAAPGTLSKLVNGYVTSGATIKKRKDFVRVQIPASCYGLESTSKGLVTFGSSSLNTNTDGLLLDVFGASLYYQQLRHPRDILMSATTPKFSLVKVLSSCVRSDKAFVIAEFCDGRRFMYYDGALVWDAAAGVIYDADCQFKNPQMLQQAASRLVATSDWTTTLYPPNSIALTSPSDETVVASVNIVGAEGWEAGVRATPYGAIEGTVGVGPWFSVALEAGTYSRGYVQLQITKDATTFAVYTNLLNSRYVCTNIAIVAGYYNVTFQVGKDSLVCLLGAASGVAVEDFAFALYCGAGDKLCYQRYQWDSGVGHYVLSGLEGFVILKAGGAQLSADPLKGTAAQIVASIANNINTNVQIWPGRLDNEYIQAVAYAEGEIELRLPASFTGTTLSYTFGDFTKPYTDFTTKRDTPLSKQLLVAPITVAAIDMSSDIRFVTTSEIPLSVSVNPSPVVKSEYSSIGVPTSKPMEVAVAVSVNRGSGNYTYAWTRVSAERKLPMYSPRLKVSTMATQASVVFVVPFVIFNITQTDIWQVEIVDTVTSRKATVQVPLTFSYGST